ncbi:MAG: hypothetical protein U1F77_10465 [Kiritimatiellia bacterium]
MQAAVIKVPLPNRAVLLQCGGGFGFELPRQLTQRQAVAQTEQYCGMIRHQRCTEQGGIPPGEFVNLREEALPEIR